MQNQGTNAKSELLPILCFKHWKNKKIFVYHMCGLVLTPRCLIFKFFLEKDDFNTLIKVSWVSTLNTPNFFYGASQTLQPFMILYAH
jgi:hypothetical protein